MAQDLSKRTATEAIVPANRVEWLDGVRALAALFVVLHHAWLMTVGGYPLTDGPWFTDWLVYGHLAVSVFIVVSGYSLTLSPAKHAMHIQGGGWGFLRRRFWRIVPPYWAALALVSLLISAGVTGPANGTDYSSRDFLVHFFLVQDTFGNVSPNGAFWSIAVEWHIYFLFPLIVVCFRRYGVGIVLILVTGLVVAQHLLGSVIPLVEKFDRFTPIYLVLFAAGAAAAWLVRRAQGARTGLAIAIVLSVSVVTFMVLAGGERTTGAYFWVDLLVGTATAALFVALAQGRMLWLARLLSTRPLASVGAFAFSLYLIHAPVLAILTSYVINPAAMDSITSLALLLLLGCPISVGAAFLFFLVFERPFLTIRSFHQFFTWLLFPFTRMLRSPAAVSANRYVRSFQQEHRIKGNGR